MSDTPKPKRGDVWRVELDPVVGSEQSKTRPVVVMSGGDVGRPTVRVCVPITNFQEIHIGMSWCVPIAPDKANGLTKPSTADASQIRALDIERFEGKLGKLESTPLAAIAATVALCVGHKPPQDTQQAE